MHTLARTGVALFGFTLAAATVAAPPPPAGDGLVASASDTAPSAAQDDRRIAVEEAALTRVLLRELRPVRTSIPSPTPSPSPTPVPTLPPPATYAGGPAVPVVASWYGPGFYGNRLPCWRWLQASALPIQFQADTWGVAHKTLPCGTMLRLRHGDNLIVVPVVDRGPYVAGRELDLSLRVRDALDCSDLCTVLMQIP